MSTRFRQNEQFISQLGKSPGVERLCRARAEAGMTNMVSAAPVDTGAYKAGFRIERRMAKHRVVIRVVNRDRKTLLIEARRGVMARGLRQAARG